MKLQLSQAAEICTTKTMTSCGGSGARPSQADHLILAPYLLPVEGCRSGSLVS